MMKYICHFGFYLLSLFSCLDDWNDLLCCRYVYYWNINSSESFNQKVQMLYWKRTKLKKRTTWNKRQIDETVFETVKARTECTWVKLTTRFNNRFAIVNNEIYSAGTLSLFIRKLITQHKQYQRKRSDKN